jgi:hypothetical protein
MPNRAVPFDPPWASTSNSVVPEQLIPGRSPKPNVNAVSLYQVQVQMAANSTTISGGRGHGRSLATFVCSASCIYMNERGRSPLAIITTVVNHVGCHISMIPYGSTYGLEYTSVRNHPTYCAAPPPPTTSLCIMEMARYRTGLDP